MNYDYASFGNGFLVLPVKTTVSLGLQCKPLFTITSLAVMQVKFVRMV